MVDFNSHKQSNHKNQKSWKRNRQTMLLISSLPFGREDCSPVSIQRKVQSTGCTYVHGSWHKEQAITFPWWKRDRVSLREKNGRWTMTWHQHIVPSMMASLQENHILLAGETVKWTSPLPKASWGDYLTLQPPPPSPNPYHQWETVDGSLLQWGGSSPSSPLWRGSGSASILLIKGVCFLPSA